METKELEQYNVSKYNTENLFQNQGKKNLGSPSGLSLFDENVEFFGLCGLTGVPGKGKTSLAIQIMIHNVFVLEKPVVYISLEVNKDMLISKIISYMIGVNVKDILTGKMNLEETRKYVDALIKIKSSPNLYLLDTKQAKLEVIENIIHAAKKNHLKMTGEDANPLVVLDYLNIFYDYGNVNGSSTTGEKQGNQMKELIRMKNETSANFIIIVAKNKQGYKQAEMSSLKGSNDLEYGFETIISLEEVDEEFPIINYPPNKKTGFLEVNVLAVVMKNRWGESKRKIPLYFKGKSSRFFEPDHL